MSASEVERSAADSLAGKRTLAMSLPPRTTTAVQLKGEAALDDGHAHEVAAEGVSGVARPLTHRDTIHRLFGRYDIRDVKAQIGGAAADAARQLGADAYAKGQTVAFRSDPDLHTAAHEAVYTVQQAGGVQLAGPPRSTHREGAGLRPSSRSEHARVTRPSTFAGAVAAAEDAISCEDEANAGRGDAGQYRV